MKERKGISTFIATLLLMVLAVSAGVVIYAYTMGYLGGFGGTESLGAMSVDTNEGNTTYIWAYVRNIGKTDLNITRAYIDGELYDGSVISNGTTTGYIYVEEGGIEPIYLNGNFTANKSYQVKLIAADNTQVSFSVKIG